MTAFQLDAQTNRDHRKRELPNMSKRNVDQNRKHSIA